MSNTCNVSGMYNASLIRTHRVEFDLGSLRLVSAVKFDLWGSDASPRACSLSRSTEFPRDIPTKESKGWQLVGKAFEIPKKKTR